MPRLMSVEDRFWSKVDIRENDECWPWLAAVNNSGYGWFKGANGPIGAHRFSFELTSGPIPDGLAVLHACDNRMCVNPDHLSAGTNQDNVNDKMTRGRHPNMLMTHCRSHGHPFDAENTYITPKGHRMCRACNRLAQQRYWRKKRAA